MAIKRKKILVSNYLMLDFKIKTLNSFLEISNSNNNSNQLYLKNWQFLRLLCISSARYPFKLCVKDKRNGKNHDNKCSAIIQHLFYSYHFNFYFTKIIHHCPSPDFDLWESYHILRNSFPISQYVIWRKTENVYFRIE